MDMRNSHFVTFKELGPVHGRYLEVGLYGKFTQPQLATARRHYASWVRASSPSIITLDELSEVGDQWDAQSLSSHSEGCSEAASALIVRGDQAGFWGDYCKALAKRGVVKLLFLDSERQLAHRWAARHALLNS